MPDLGTHVLAGYWIKRYLCRTEKLFLIPLFLLGCILPDLVFKSSEVFFSYDYYWFLHIFHTPLSLLLQCILLSLLFERGKRWMVFLSISGGALLHLLLDSTQIHITGTNYFWLFPLSNWSAEIGGFPKHLWPYTLAGTIALIVVSYSIMRLLRSGPKR
jgi:hypothetical protein